MGVVRLPLSASQQSHPDQPDGYEDEGAYTSASLPYTFWANVDRSDGQLPPTQASHGSTVERRLRSESSFPFLSLAGTLGQAVEIRDGIFHLPPAPFTHLRATSNAVRSNPVVRR
jgi:hypothetical protein